MSEPTRRGSESKRLSGPLMMKEVVQAEGRPVHQSIIARRVLSRDRKRRKHDRRFRGATPEATMYAKLAMSHKLGGDFVRTAPAVYGLRAWTQEKLQAAPLLPEDRPTRAASRVETSARPRTGSPDVSPRSEKVSITLDPELLQETREYAAGNLSAWVGEAVRHRVLLERAREFLREEAEARGPISNDLLDDVRRKWPDSPSIPAR